MLGRASSEGLGIAAARRELSVMFGEPSLKALLLRCPDVVVLVFKDHSDEGNERVVAVPPHFV